MNRTMKRLLVLVLFVFGVGAPAALAQNDSRPADSMPLAPGNVVSDSLASNDVRAYTIELAADQFVYGETDQQTVDVVLTVYGPDGETLERYDAAARGPEPFHFDSDSAGLYRVEVTPYEKGRGHYTIVLKRVEPVATVPARRVDQLMAAYDGRDRPGAVVGVVRNGEVSFSEGYGMASLAYDIPIARETRFNLGSVSKQFLAFAFALLAERGELSLDDPVGKYLSDWPEFDETVRLRHLLTHTSGYREAYGTHALAGRITNEDRLTREEALEVVRRQPALEFPAGSDYQYNSTAYVILAEILEKVVGMPAGQWVEENVFESLGMTVSTIESEVGEIVPNAAVSYAPAGDGTYHRSFSNRAIFGAADVYTTVGDLAKWFRNFETGELGGRVVQERMREPFVLTTGDTTDYALGLVVDEHQGLQRIQHGGSHAGYRAMIMYYPDLEAGIVVMSNYSRMPVHTIAESVAETFLGDQMPVELPVESVSTSADDDAVQLSPADFQAIAGRYELEQVAGYVLNFTREDETYFLQENEGEKTEITPTSDSTFAVPGSESRIIFHLAEGDEPAPSLALQQENAEYLANRLTGEPWEPSREDSLEYTGRYYSEELETFYAVTATDSQLVVEHRWLGEIVLAPVTKDTFSGRYPIQELVFVRDEEGQVAGLHVSTGRTRDVRFEKQK